MASAIDATRPVEGNPTTQSVRDNFAAAKSEIETLQATAGVGPEGPTGPAGPTGSPATIAVGTTTTAPAGTNASVSNSGNANSAVFNFTIPRGESGTDGGGITEQEAIDAVRTARPLFADAGATTYGTSSLTVDAPDLGAGWTLVSGSGATAVYHHAAGNTANLSFPITGLTNGSRHWMSWDSVTGAADVSGSRFAVYFATSAGATSGTGTASQWYNRDFLAAALPATGSYTHLVIVPDSAWDGNIRLVSGGVVRVTSTLSPSMFWKDSNTPVYTTSLNICLGPYAGGATWVNGPPACGYGGYAMQEAHGGHFGCGFGYYALRYASTRSYGSDQSLGASNTGIGNYALQNCTAGFSNTALGMYCMSAEIIGGYNTAAGYYALGASKAGSNNTAVGRNAGRYLSDGSTAQVVADDSVFVGAQSRGAVSDGQTNQIVIGFNAIGAGSNSITLGNDAITELHCNVQAISVLSDPRVKEDIHPADLDICLNALKSLPVHRWTWGNNAGVRRDKHVTGFLSEELEQIFPKAVTTGPGCLVRRDDDGKPIMTTVTEEVPVWNEEDPENPKLVEQTREVEEVVQIDDLRRVNLTELVPTLWGAVQRLMERVEELEAQLRTPQTPPQPAAAQAPPEPAAEPPRRPRRER